MSIIDRFFLAVLSEFCGINLNSFWAIVLNSINFKNGKSPKVSIGMPVYNGANFIEEALDSLLSQTFRDFELIISDNGSSDKTEEICQNYASRDSRIKYYRHTINRGAAWNFNHLVDLALGKYFMWAAHDDIWLSTFLEETVNVLDQNPYAVLCYSSYKEMDGNGDGTNLNHSINPILSSQNAHHRYGAGWQYPPQIIVFGLIRIDMLKRTRRIGNYVASDQILVSELSLLGPFIGIKRCLYMYRRHKQQSTGNPYPTMYMRIAWFDPKKSGKITFPYWRLLRERIIGVSRTPIKFISWRERFFCYISTIRWVVRTRRGLFLDLAPFLRN